MNYIILGILILFSAINNLLRGRGINFFTSKLMTSLYAGIAWGSYYFYTKIDPEGYYFYQTQELVGAGVVALIIFLGVWLWAVMGWGKYFMSFTGTDVIDEKEVAWIDWLTTKIYKWPETASERMRWGTIAMGLRGTHIVPLFLCLGWYLDNWLIAPIGLLLLVQGLIYGAMRWVPWVNYRVAIAEFITGAVIGLMLTLALGVI